MCVLLCSCRPVPCTSWPGVRCGVCAWAWVAAAPCHSWLGCWGVCVFVCAPRLYPAIPGSVVRCGRVCSARVSAVQCHSWQGVGVFVRSCVCPASTPPFLAGWCVRVSVWVSSALRYSWLSGLGAGARGLLPAPRPFPVTFWGAVCGFGVCGCCRGRGLRPPPLWCFFRGGGRRGVSCCGFVVSFAGCPGLGSRGLLPPFPSRLGCTFVSLLFFFLRLYPSVVCVGMIRVSVLPVGRYSRFSVACLGWVVLWCPFGRLAFGVVWLWRLLWCGWAASWLWDFLVPLPPVVFFFRAGSACSSLCLP